MTMSMWEYEIAQLLNYGDGEPFTIPEQHAHSKNYHVNLKKDSDEQIDAQFDAEMKNHDREVIPFLMYGNLELRWYHAPNLPPLVQTHSPE